MNRFRLSWSIGEGASKIRGVMPDASWVDVYRALVDAHALSGTVTVDLSNAPAIGPQSLQTQTDTRHFLITLGVDDGDDYIVRDYSNEHAHPGTVEMLGAISAHVFLFVPTSKSSCESSRNSWRQATSRGKSSASRARRLPT